MQSICDKETLLIKILMRKVDIKISILIKHSTTNHFITNIFVRRYSIKVSTAKCTQAPTRLKTVEAFILESISKMFN